MPPTRSSEARPTKFGPVACSVRTSLCLPIPTHRRACWPSWDVKAELRYPATTMGVFVTEQADVVVVGMGPGGENAAGRLAEAGLDVVGVDAELVGGECPYWGCIPSKMMIRAADLLAEGRRIPGMAGEAEVHPDWTPVARRIRVEATDDWDDAVAVERFVNKGGRFVRGWGRLDGPGRVVVGDQVIEASRAVVLATGTRVWLPPVPGLADTPYWTN